jgi:hypothetical protein
MIMHFMIEGELYRCRYKRFAKILGFTNENGLGKNNVHDYYEPKDEEIDYMHLDSTSLDDYCQTSHMLPYYRYVNLLVRQTIIPKGGNGTRIQSTAKIFLTFFYENDGDFNVFDVIWKEIMTTLWTPLQSCTHAPYLMRMIEVVTKKCFVKTVTHRSYVPLRINPEDPPHRFRKTAKTTSSCSSSSPISYPPSRPSSSRAAAASRGFTYRPGHGGLECILKK